MTQPEKAGCTGEYRLDLGGTVISLQCDSDQISNGFAQWFARPSSALDPHIQLELKIVNEPYDVILPNSRLTTKALGDGGTFRIAEDLITGEFDPDGRRGVIRANQILFQMPLVRVLEQIFYQAFYSARRFSGLDSFLVHSSAVISRGAGFLFAFFRPGALAEDFNADTALRRFPAKCFEKLESCLIYVAVMFSTH